MSVGIEWLLYAGLFLSVIGLVWFNSLLTWSVPLSALGLIIVVASQKV